jgi:hypothetical protein
MTSNAQFIANYQARRYHAGGVTAATEPLLTCPVCGIKNFSARGLAAHCCRAKPGREKLSAQEIALARSRAATPLVSKN